MNWKSLIKILPLFFLVAGLVAQEIETEGQTFYIPQFAHGLGLDTTINFINLSDITNRVEVEAYAEDGTPANLLRRRANPFETRDTAVSLAAEEMAGLGTASISSFSSDEGTLAPGWVRITSTGPVGVEVIFNVRDASSGALATSTSVLPEAATAAASFIAAVTTAANTGVALLNPLSNPGSAIVTLTLYDRLGGGMGRAQVSLARGEKTARFVDQLFSLSGGEEFMGTVELSSDVPVVVTVLRQEGVHLTTQALHASRLQTP